MTQRDTFIPTWRCPQPTPKKKQNPLSKYKRKNLSVLEWSFAPPQLASLPDFKVRRLKWISSPLAYFPPSPQQYPERRTSIFPTKHHLLLLLLLPPQTSPQQEIAQNKQSKQQQHANAPMIPAHIPDPELPPRLSSWYWPWGGGYPCCCWYIGCCWYCIGCCWYGICCCWPP